MKTCKKCKIERPFTEFYIRMKGKYKCFECKICHKQYALNNLDKIKANKKIYNNTKAGFLLSSYGSMRGQYKRKIKENFPKDRLKSYEVFISKEEFLGMVNSYEKERGFVCQGTNMPLTTLRNLNKDRKTCPTNFSVDRLDTQIGYSKKNIIFVSWEFNERKKSVRIEDCFTILKLYKERYPEKYQDIKIKFKELFI
jgi:hypothetical protein